MKQIVFVTALLVCLLATNDTIAQCKNSSFSVVLLGGFHKDRVKLIIDDKKLFDTIITSDPSTDLAGSCSFKKLSRKQKVLVIINGRAMRAIYLDHKNL